MPPPRDPSWLLARNPPHAPEDPKGEPALWWAVLRQSAHDLRFGHESHAIDALEFLRDTGQWLASEFFGVERDAYQREVAALVFRRNRETGKPLPIPQRGTP